MSEKNILVLELLDDADAEQLLQFLSMIRGVRTITRQIKSEEPLPVPEHPEHYLTLLDAIFGVRDSVDPDIDVAVLANRLEGLLRNLLPRERETIAMHFGLAPFAKPMIYEEIGAYYDVTKVRARQIAESGLRKLRHPERSRTLRPFVRKDDTAAD